MNYFNQNLSGHIYFQDELDDLLKDYGYKREKESFFDKLKNFFKREKILKYKGVVNSIKIYYINYNNNILIKNVEEY